MNADEILELIQVATQLAKIINANIKATNNAEAQAAWDQARANFLQGMAEDRAAVEADGG
jgi:hypothetical protein